MRRPVSLLGVCLISVACGYNPQLDYGDASRTTGGTGPATGGVATGGVPGPSGNDTGAGGAVEVTGGGADSAASDMDVIEAGVVSASDGSDIPMGGTVGAGGAIGTGGAVASGGSLGSGGAVASGGSLGSGGAVASGGSTGNGGINGTGGAAPNPVVSDFSALPATITAGKSSTLKWVASGATSLSIDQGVGVVTGSTSIAVTPAKTTAYTLTAQNADGVSVKKDVTVTVVPLPTISRFTVSPETISAGSRATLMASFVDGTQAAVDQGVGTVATGASLEVGPLSASTTFTLTVTNPAGDSVTAKATVTVVPLPTIASFTAALTPILSGSNTTLTATFANGTGMVDHGIGAVTSSRAASTGALSTTTVYTLTVTNPAGDVANAKATVTVASPGSFAAVPMVVPRGAAHTATLLSSGKVLVTGGMTATTSDSAEVFDPATGTFTATSPMKVQRFFHTATLLKSGQVLVCGGENPGTGAANSTAELYDPATGAFVSTGSMTTARSYHAAALLGDGTVLVTAGQNSTELNTAELYDPAAGTFKALSSTLNTGKTLHSVWWLPTLGKAAVLGGNGGVGVSFYDPTAQTFSGAGNMRIYRSFSAVTLMGDGRILTTGGLDEHSIVLESAEVFDPSTQSSSSVGDMSTTRAFHTSVLLDNGQVLITGGIDANIGGNDLASAELYDPTVGVFKTTGPMSFPRTQHTATALPNRKALIVGGNGGADLYFY